MSACAISVRFKVHARRSGLPIAEASAYALRHSFAMRLLGAGVGIKLIGDLMGHRSMDSTSAYLRIQTDMLREVALEVPAEVTP
jgi:integrase/recombinase XerD